jgi:hypothetical protein
MTPIISSVVTWLTNKFAGSKAFPAPNDELRIRLGTGQYEIYFITNADEAFTAADSIRDKPLHHPATTKHGVIIADSATTANDPGVQSAIESNHSGDTSTYLGYLELHEVKKWPNTAP